MTRHVPLNGQRVASSPLAAVLRAAFARGANPLSSTAMAQGKLQTDAQQGGFAKTFSATGKAVGKGAPAGFEAFSPAGRAYGGKGAPSTFSATARAEGKNF